MYAAASNVLTIFDLSSRLANTAIIRVVAGRTRLVTAPHIFCFLPGISSANAPHSYTDQRHNLVKYHGALAPNAKLKELIVPKNSKRVKGDLDSRTYKSVGGVASQDELIAPLSRGSATHS
jgi:hypothetical protein